ncbi:MAG: response regulator transcription factor [Thermodesulfobacteriota bacterium]
MLNDVQIFIFGRFALQNQLLATHFRKLNASTCRIFSDRDEIQSALCRRGSCDSLVVLLDAHSLPADGRDFPFRTMRDTGKTAVFNLAPSFGLEWGLIRNGVRGVFYEHDTQEVLVKGIQTMMTGELWFPRRILSAMVCEDEGWEDVQEGARVLTSREQRILQALCGGASNPQIAEALCISPYTVKTHLYNIYRKINVTSRHQACQWAMSNWQQFPTDTKVVEALRG